MKQEDINIIQSMWMVPGTSIQDVEAIAERSRLKHGMFSSVPMVCKGVDCPYFQTCTASPQARMVDSRCVVEIGTLLARYEVLCRHFGIDLSEPTIQDKDLVDASMIRDLVDNEIQILRAENKIAISADFMAKHISQIDKKCNPYYEDIIHPAAEYKMKLLDQRYRLLQKLNATRKDKVDILKNTNSYSAKAQSIIDKVKNKAKDLNIDDINEINNSISDLNP